MSDVSRFGQREVKQTRSLDVTSGACEVEVTSRYGTGYDHHHRLTEAEALDLVRDVIRRVAIMQENRGERQTIPGAVQEWTWETQGEGSEA